MAAENNQEEVEFPAEYLEKLEIYRADMLKLRAEAGLTLAEVSELCGFTPEEISAQEEKTAPLDAIAVTSAVLVYYLMLYTNDKAAIKERLCSIPDSAARETVKS